MHTNRLAREKSPYLLQHQHNPVDWYPWGEEAFARARQDGKPIFLSIGYSTCHWCHVMERESFEDSTVAAFLNTHFVAIKVDREERPDVDEIYMTFVQATAGQGGWPLNVFLTPDLKPFFGGTYWPPADRYGRAGFLTVLQQIRQAWQIRRDEVTASADDIHRHLEQAVQPHDAGRDSLVAAVVERAGLQMKDGFDAANGGWGHAPKFPSPSYPAFLLMYGTEYEDREAVDMVLRTANAMAAGGIHDQLGGGFHRYAVDEKWLVPHFEKMLYDNAQLLNLYLDCYQVSGDVRYAEVARGIVAYVRRDMTHPGGGFYSAEDADSEGKEGKFFCWTQDELGRLLTDDEREVVVRYYGVTAGGNFVDHSDPEPLPGLNVLSVVDTTLTIDDRARLASGKAKLLRARSQRVRPYRDDKILTSWNGLMLGALARASVVLDDAASREAAERNLTFLQDHLWDESTHTLHHRWRDGACDSVQLLDDYAFLLAGTLELYQATLQPAPLAFAVELADALMLRFTDGDHGGFWQSGSQGGDLILRVKIDRDGVEPSGNSVAARALLKLAAITARPDYRAAADACLQALAPRLVQTPRAVPYLLAALDFAVTEPRRVVLAGDPATAAAAALIQAAHAVYQPRKVVLGTTGPVDAFARTLPARDGQPTVYLCTGQACQPPTHEPGQVTTLLR